MMEITTVVNQIFQMRQTARLQHAPMPNSTVTMAYAHRVAGAVMGLMIVGMALMSLNVVSVSEIILGDCLNVANFLFYKVISALINPCLHLWSVCSYPCLLYTHTEEHTYTISVNIFCILPSNMELRQSR